MVAVAAGGGPAPSSSSKGTNNVEPASDSGATSSKDKPGKTSEDDYKDMTGMFNPIGDDDVEDELDQSNKEKFVAADLLVPGIAMKKFKLSLHDEMGEGNDIQPESFIGILSVGDISKYKHTRPILKRMAMGDCMKERFWASVGSHLHGHPIAAIVKTRSSMIQLKDVSWLPCSMFVCGSHFLNRGEREDNGN